MFKWFIAILLFTNLSVKAQRYRQKPKTNTSAAALNTSKDSLSYALGINIGRNLQAQGLTNIDALKLYKGLSDILLKKKPLLTDDEAAQKVSNYTANLIQKTTPATPPQTLRTAPKPAPNNPKPVNTPPKQSTYENPEAAKNKEIGKQFLEQNAKKDRVVSMPEGWQYYILHQSTDTAKPDLRNTIKCHYHGTLIDGTVFESTYGTNEPAIFPLFRVVKGLQLALTKMTVGSKWRIFLPSHLAYGDRGVGEIIKPGALLIFDVELLKIEK